MRTLYSEPSLPTLNSQGSVESFQLALTLSQRESMWLLTHSPRSPLEPTFPSPTSSAFEVPIGASRPATSTISTMTTRQNERLEQRLAHLSLTSPCFEPRAATASQLVDPRRLGLKSPSDRDFRRVLDRLDKITSSQGTAYGRVNLKEGKAFDMPLDQGDRQHFRISTRNSPCPLRIAVKRTGKTVLYLSRTLMEPSEALYDMTTKGEKLVLSDPGLKFKTESVFLTLIAQEDCKFTILATFGREVQEGGKLTIRKRNIHRDGTLKVLDEIKKDEKRLMELYSTVEEIEKKRKSAALLRSQSKDFIELNKAVHSPRPELYRERLDQLALRTSQAKTLKAIHIEAKKGRALAMIYRREQLQEMARQTRLSAEARLRRQASERKVVLTVFLTVSMERMYGAFVQGKLRAANEHRKATAAVRIQYQIRKWFNRVDRTGLAFLIVHSAFHLFHQLCSPLLLAESSHIIKMCAADSRSNHKLASVFRTFYRRTVLMQQVWKRYQERLKRQWTEVNNCWAHALDVMKADSLRKKTPGKKGRGGKKKDETALYNISAAAKQQVLASFILERKKAYRSYVKAYLQDTKLLRQIGAQAYQMRHHSLDAEEMRAATAAPVLVLLPSTEEMAKLVEAAIVLST